MLICNTLPTPLWEAAPDFQALAGASVFRVCISGNRHHAARAATVLTATEQQRASRYHRPEDSERFLLSRAALRLLLGAYSGQPAASLEFVPGPNKKPVLGRATGLHYNVSHSGNWILLAIAATEVGIDVEKIDARFAYQDILADSFSSAERAFIGEGPASRAQFYQLWTRKEALVKATAQGIDEKFGRVPALDGPHPAGSVGQSWLVSSFAVAADYAAAVAYPLGLANQVRFYEVGEALFRALY